ncbi:MAG: amidase family protein, partial [Pseudomonadota bacterium]
AAEARLRAGRPASPLDGVPVAWKDLVDMAGETTTVASSLLRDNPPAREDAPVVANAARAGMVSLGKLNLAEFAFSALGQNPHFGTPHNPAGRAPTAPGGSSSGSGAAVAGGLAPVALGSDTGGSVRIPASFCGVVGFKTSEGRIPIEGAFALSRTQDTLGPLGRSVEDCALIDAVWRGAPAAAPPPADIAGLTILVPTGAPMADLAPAVAAAFDASLERLAAAGARILEAPLPALDRAAEMLAAGRSLIAAEAFVEHRALIEGPEGARLDPRIRARIEIGGTMSAADLLSVQRLRAEGMAEIAAMLDGALLAMPTTPITAPALADFEGDDEAFRRLNLRTNRNTNLGSLYNTPGLAIPSGRDEAGLPTSFLLSAPGGEDDRLLRAGLAAEALIRHTKT